MTDMVREAVVVSDGIMVEFASGECCYYPASFLVEHFGVGSNHIFLNYDPSGVKTAIRPAVDDIAELLNLSASRLV